MSSLAPLLTDRAAVSNDLAEVIDAQVKAQTGMSGTAVKGAYAAARKFKPGIVVAATSAMLPDFLDALSPLWDSRPAGTSFGAHLAARSDEASEALLAVTDRQAQTAPAALAKAYKSLRGKAKTYVAQALVPVGDVIERHAAGA
ncbi:MULTISPECIES: DUF6918 family protein [unclassified Gordonia (in: high G+C Gram-positive bacteria)]|uniref:DUF6918 family protein n=1 Tax=unclassified Gordonia (in: high G+C Gram-positive bacteria) TaxID=2657482 RepID=UPI001FFE6FD3|nr:MULTISPECIES: hypothetical protein [unclassified Gordonia (in: high G+C Gram-positive bacteria)]UQE75649.1 hypothetical protein MYK68_03245 [Gordonia sp. PP30]